ncbi:transcription termination/antitermination protein NusG [Ichthyobacterium seriolicida]|uniref:Transcription termination/antitermination protein NusG n=1 Tax=Ichthyobacterium seriolicida TaxID=242600 RepID=A0A169Q4A0_9FLAO|nr:transcription termination/antitermination protein NusG [Ichthyobacterium seriolicida]BAU88538.1 transcription termination/antitermination factor NusG [Ichthyobacterium seriolicida]BAV94126.1 transcription antitermination protein NusG [Ichthyobacterium seriolicida]
MDRDKWHVIRVVSGKEKKIKSHIENEVSVLGLSESLYQILVPTEKVYQIKNGKKISKDKIHFPGYVMINADLSGELPHIIKSTPNVVGFLGERKGGDPIPMRKHEVSRMLGDIDKFSESDESVSIPYMVGESVKVIDGVFSGFIGEVEVINEEKRRLEVMVKIFGRKTPLELNYMQVEKI